MIYLRRFWVSPLPHRRLFSLQPPPEGSFKNINTIASPFLESLQSLFFTQKIKSQVLPMSFEFLAICPRTHFQPFSTRCAPARCSSKTPKVPPLRGITGCTSSDVLHPHFLQVSAPNSPPSIVLPWPSFLSQQRDHTLSPRPGCLFLLAIITPLQYALSHQNLPLKYEIPESRCHTPST